jgi:hypothetical protein
MLASLRCLDTFTKVDGSWLFAERVGAPRRALDPRDTEAREIKEFL